MITHAEGRWCKQQSFNGKRQAPVIRERSRRPRLAVKPSRLDWASRISLGVALCIGLIGRSLPAADVPAPLSMLLKNNCLDCHDGAAAEGGRLTAEPPAHASGAPPKGEEEAGPGKASGGRGRAAAAAAAMSSSTRDWAWAWA